MRGFLHASRSVALALGCIASISAGLQVGAGGAAATGIAERGSSVARVFYVDPLRGDDAASGRTARAALRTLDQIARLDLRPGDRVRLRAGVVHRGELAARQSGTARKPIVVDSYGGDARPVVRSGACVRVDGSHWRISAILARDCSFAGFLIRGDGVELHDVEAEGNVVGVGIEPAADQAVVSSSYLHDNSRMAPDTPGSDDDYGASGIVVSGSRAVIADNLIEGHRAPSADYGHDGTAIEVYGATGTRIHRNIARDNLSFVELGHSTTRHTSIDYNSVSSGHPRASFLITRGASTFGPVLDTVATHNSVRLTGVGSIGVSCHPSCSPGILQIGSNVIQAYDVGYAEAANGSLASISLGHNVYEELAHDDWYGLTIVPTDVRALIGFDHSRGDLRLKAGSPAVDIGGSSWSRDILGAPAPADGDGDGRTASDAGAFERQTRAQ